jgi:hypothetical protein
VALREAIGVRRTVKNIGPLKGRFERQNEWERDKALTGEDWEGGMGGTKKWRGEKYLYENEGRRGKLREDGKEQWPFKGPIYRVRVNGRRENKTDVRIA